MNWLNGMLSNWMLHSCVSSVGSPSTWVPLSWSSAANQVVFPFGICRTFSHPQSSIEFWWKTLILILSSLKVNPAVEVHSTHLVSSNPETSSKGNEMSQGLEAEIETFEVEGLGLKQPCYLRVQVLRSHCLILSKRSDWSDFDAVAASKSKWCFWFSMKDLDAPQMYPDGLKQSSNSVGGPSLMNTLIASYGGSL